MTWGVMTPFGHSYNRSKGGSMSSYLINLRLSAVNYQKVHMYQTGKRYFEGSSGAVTYNIGHGGRDMTEKLKSSLIK